MNVKYIPKTNLGAKLKANKRYRIVFFAICGFVINLLFALYNGALGIIFRSTWFLSLCAYYTVLSSMRFGTVLQDRRNISTEKFIARFCGVMLIVLALVLSGSVYLSLAADIAVKHQEIIMLTIATYTFYKVVLAIINTVKVRKENSLLLSSIRNIGCADAAVSILSLQRSMLVSFGAMEREDIFLMNVLTGAGVFLIIVLLGITLIVKSVKGGQTNE